MTTQTSFSDKKSANRRFFNTKYFRFRLKTGWPLLVVFVFIFVLSLAVPTVAFVADLFDRTDGFLNGSGIPILTFRKDTVEFLYGLGLVNVVISMFGGLLCGMTTMRFTDNKVAVNFYHSLPMRREAIFVTSTLQSFLYYVIAFAAGLLFTFANVSLRLGDPAMFVRPLLLTFEYGVLFFFLVYSMTLFAASLTGTGFMRFIGAAYVVFLPIAMFALFIVAVGNCGIYNNILDIDYYLSAEFVITLCSPLRLMNLLGTDALGNTVFVGAVSKDTVIVLITAIVYYGLAFLLYCVRQSESASHPIIWKPARFVFKYSSMFMGGTLFALMFYGMFESIPWLVFGIIIGSVIVFMFTNGIIHKSARAIFKGLRGLGVYMAVMAVVTVVFYCDVFGMFANVPDASMVNRVELTLDYNVKTEFGGDFAGKVTNLIKKTRNKDGNDIYSYDGIVYEEVGGTKPLVEVYTEDDSVNQGYVYQGYEYQSMSVEAVLHTKFGIPYAIRFYPTCETAYDLAKFVYESGKVDMELPVAEDIDSGYIETYLQEYGEYDDSGLFRKGANSADLVRYVSMLSDPFGLESKSPIVGEICLYVEPDDFTYVYSSFGRYRNYLIHANDVQVLNELSEGSDLHFDSEEDVVSYFIEYNGIEGFNVVDNDKVERVGLVEGNTVLDIAKSLYTFNTYSNDTTLCGREHRYNVFIRQTPGEEYSGCLHFRKGAVPARVTELFGE